MFHGNPIVLLLYKKPVYYHLHSHIYHLHSHIYTSGIPLYYHCITIVLPLYYHSQYIWNKIDGRPPRQHWAATASGNGKRNSEVSLRHGRVVFRWFFGGHGGHGVAPNHPQNLQSVYPLVICYIAMERSTIFNGKIHYKWPFSITMLNYQRVNLKQTFLCFSVVRHGWISTEELCGSNSLIHDMRHDMPLPSDAWSVHGSQPKCGVSNECPECWWPISLRTVEVVESQNRTIYFWDILTYHGYGKHLTS